MTKPQLGTLAWAELTRGNLRRSDRRKQILSALGIKLSLMAKSLLRLHPKIHHVDLDTIIIPDSAIAQNATDLCQEVSSDMLANHCLRTYFWGALLAAADNLNYDAELFYTAALLHDLGLTENFSFKNTNCDCFAYEGAIAAEKFARDKGCWPREKSQRLAEAICLHLNLIVPQHLGIEAHLLHEGAVADLIGARINSISPDNTKSVLERYPRLKFKEEIIPLLSEQAKRRPQCRMALHMAGGLGKLIFKAPFDD